VKKSTLIIAAAWLICLPGLASAAMISYTDNIAMTTTGWTDTLDFNKFDPSLGTLTQVELQISSGMVTTLTVKNTGTIHQTNGTAWITQDLSVKDAGGYIANFPQISATIPDSPYQFSHLAHGASVTSSQYTYYGSSDSFYTSNLLLAEFTGTDNISLSASTPGAEPHWTVNGSTTVDVTALTKASLEGTITYTYTLAPVAYPPQSAIPIPPSALLLGSGLLGLAGLRRLRKP
jgi:hypothetical protein